MFHKILPTIRPKRSQKGYRRVSICTCHEAVMKNSKEPNLGDEGQSALSEQKGTETSLPIRGTVIYNFTSQVFFKLGECSTQNIPISRLCSRCALYISFLSLIITHLVLRVVPYGTDLARPIIPMSCSNCVSVSKNPNQSQY